MTASKNNPIVDALMYEKSHGFPSSMKNTKKTTQKIPQNPGTQIAGKKKIEEGGEKTTSKIY